MFVDFRIILVTGIFKNVYKNSVFQNEELAESAADNFLYILEPLKFLVRIQCLLVL